VLYSYEPKHFGITADAVVHVHVLTAWLHERELMTKMIKLRLTRGQDRMKRYIDKHRAECYFVVGDSVLIKLVQHRMVTRGGDLITQVKVLWSDMAEELATRDDAEAFALHSQAHQLGGKLAFKAGGMSATQGRWPVAPVIISRCGVLWCARQWCQTRNCGGWAELGQQEAQEEEH
jgi:hypothetical protein